MNNNMGYDQNGMGYDQNNMGYDQNGGMGGGYPQQPMGGMNQPMGGMNQPMQQQMMQQQRFGGMNQPMMNNQPMQQGYGMNDPMMNQQPMYDQPNTSFGGSSGDSGNKKNQIPIIIAMILVLVVGGVIIAFLLKDDSSSGGSGKKKKEETEVEIKKPDKAYTGDLSNYDDLKKYYEDSFKTSCREDGNTCYMSFKDSIYLALDKENGKVKRVAVGDEKITKDMIMALLSPFANTSEKEKEIENAITWMDGGLLYSDKEFELHASKSALMVSPEPYSPANDSLVGLKENNKFTLSNIEFGKKYTVDVQHFDNNFKNISLRSLETSRDTSSGSFDYEEDGYEVRVSYKFEEDKINFDSEFEDTYFKEYTDNSNHVKGGYQCYTEDEDIECYDYVYLTESPMGHDYGVYLVIRLNYRFDSSQISKLESLKQPAKEYIKKLGSGVKVVS